MACSDHNPDFDHQKSFIRIKPDNDDRFLTRLLSKETSKSNPSFRVYYGDAPSAVPFVWEKCPGTPKHPSSEDSYNIPPLTPPPSYYTNNLNITDGSSKKQSRPKLLLHRLLRRMNNNHSKKPGHGASSSCRSSSSSSSLSSLSWSSSNSHSSSYSDPTMTPSLKKRRRFSSWGSSFDERSSVGDFRRRDEVCPSRVCFGIGKENGERVLLVKRAFLSIVGRGSTA